MDWSRHRKTFAFLQEFYLEVISDSLPKNLLSNCSVEEILLPSKSGKFWVPSITLRCSGRVSLQTLLHTLNQIKSRSQSVHLQSLSTQVSCTSKKFYNFLLMGMELQSRPPWFLSYSCSTTVDEVIWTTSIIRTSEPGRVNCQFDTSTHDYLDIYLHLILVLLAEAIHNSVTRTTFLI